MRAPAAKSWALERADGSVIRQEWPHVHGGSQFASQKTTKAIVVGRLLREPDLCNLPEEEAVSNISRLIVELLLANYSREFLRKSLLSVRPRCWVDLSRVFCLLDLSERDLSQ